MGKILGLDVGQKRIGVAIGDTTLGMAFPRMVMERKDTATTLLEIQKLCHSEKIEKIIFGEPLGEENEPTVRSIAIRAFAAEVEKHIPGTPIFFVDESFSSKQALAKIPLKRDRKVKGADDALAAAIILERYMETA